MNKELIKVSGITEFKAAKNLIRCQVFPAFSHTKLIPRLEGRQCALCGERNTFLGPKQSLLFRVHNWTF